MNSNVDRSDHNKLPRNILIGTIVVGGFLLIALLVVLGFGFQWYLSPDNKLSIVQRKDLVQGIASVAQALAVFLTGAVGLIGLYFTWKNTSQAQDSTRRTLELTEQGQITDRFTKAIDQLGKVGDKDEKIEEIRLGGIYALAHIAAEQPDNYHWPIMQVFAAYVRRYAPWRGDPSRTTTRPTDIETVLHVIGRRSRYYGAGEDEPLSLSETDLSNHIFPANAHLEGVDLKQAHFECVVLEQAQLRKADLRGAHLEGAYILNADLRGADLRGAHLEGTYLLNTDLRGANLGNAHLDATYLSKAKLQEVENLDPESLEKANGDLTTELGGVRRPTWWDNLPGSETLLFPGEYSIRLLSNDFLHFSIPSEGWLPGEGWHSGLLLPYGFALTPAGAYFTGSGLFIFDGQWVCDPHKPKETFALVRPAPRDMVAWFDNHPYLTITTEPHEWENPVSGLGGTQFEVNINANTPGTEIGLGPEGPRVPIFPAHPRNTNYGVVKGKKNRVIVLEREGATLIILIEASPDEFDRFNNRVERAVLPTVYWGGKPSDQPEGT